MIKTCQCVKLVQVFFSNQDLNSVLLWKQKQFWTNLLTDVPHKDCTAVPFYRLDLNLNPDFFPYKQPAAPAERKLILYLVQT